MAKPELGTKRICPETGRKFYDLNKDPVISPYTGKVVPVEPLVVRARPETAAAAAARAAPAPAEEAAPEPAEAEFVSLEEADAEATGGTAKKGAEPAEVEDEEVEMDESLDDAPFIEEQEEEDEDVTDIIGGDIENDEEG
jgi:uncharacterized protein (TIGR02300 family)